MNGKDTKVEGKKNPELAAAVLEDSGLMVMAFGPVMSARAEQEESED